MADTFTFAVYLSLGVLASVMLAAGLLLIKVRAEKLPPANRGAIMRAVLAWIRDPVWLCGLGLQTLGFGIYVVALAGAPVSLMAVTMQGGIALFVLFAVIFLGERAKRREWIGIAGTIVAMLALAFSLQSGVAEGPSDASALLVTTVVAMAVGLAPFSLVSLRAGGIASAIIAGICFGLANLYTKALTDDFVARSGASFIVRILDNPWIFLMSVANVGGLILLQNSFHIGRGIIAMPLSSAFSNSVQILGGIAAFEERLPANPFFEGLRIGAFTLTIVAGAMLAVGQASDVGDPSIAPAEQLPPQTSQMIR